MKKLIGYKVLTSKRTSIIRSAYPGSRLYPKNKKVTPAKSFGPLCIFESYSYANYFVQSFMLSHYIIVRCYYTKSTRNIFNINGNFKILVPVGTILAASVTCLE